MLSLKFMRIICQNEMGVSLTIRNKFKSNLILNSEIYYTLVGHPLVYWGKWIPAKAIKIYHSTNKVSTINHFFLLRLESIQSAHIFLNYRTRIILVHMSINTIDKLCCSPSIKKVSRKLMWIESRSWLDGCFNIRVSPL